jgi:hypothetical protein
VAERKGLLMRKKASWWGKKIKVSSRQKAEGKETVGGRQRAVGTKQKAGYSLDEMGEIV